jgi:glyoxylase-like metal-dependent hydrolase (beta-lactamase superfamily II)
MSDGGYTQAGLWLSDGWEAVRQLGWEAPLYWQHDPADRTGWRVFTLGGWRALSELLDTPVCHLSFFEADAFARWSDCRLPTEAEWELVACQERQAGNLLETGRLHPGAANGSAGVQQLFGDCWEWTASPYTGYPGYKSLPGALGEYNGKFMSGQMILRGGSCVTPADHIRATYRNFFPPATRWQVSGIAWQTEGNFSRCLGMGQYVSPMASASRFCQSCLEQSLALTSKGPPMGSSTLGVNVFTAPGKAMVGERPRPFGEALGFDPITSTLIFGEHDAVLVDAMLTVAEAEALADWVALHNRNLETIYITHAHFDHFYGLGILLDRFPGARAITTPGALKAMQMSFTPPVERLARQMFPGQVPTKLVGPEAYEDDTFTLEGHELHIIQQGRTDSPDSTSLYVPSISLIVAGDVVYNQCHMYVGDTTPRAERIGSPTSTDWQRSTRRWLSPVTRSPERPTLPRRFKIPNDTYRTSIGCRRLWFPTRSSSTR